MANDRPEQDMLDKLKNKCNKIEGWTVHTYLCKNTPFMDFEATVTIDNEVYYLKCEAKVASKLRPDNTINKEYGDRHNANHKVFGEIIKGRNLKDCFENNFKKCYGMVLPKRDFNFFKDKYLNMIDDWLLFGDTFNVKYVIVYDEIKNKVKVYPWSNIWNGGNPLINV